MLPGTVSNHLDLDQDLGLSCLQRLLAADNSQIISIILVNTFLQKNQNLKILSDANLGDILKM